SGGFAAFADGPDDQALAAALELYAQIVNKYPEDPLSQLAQVRVAECKMRLGKLEEASKLLEAFIQADPLGAYRGQAHVLWGDLYLEYYFDGHRAEVEYNAVFQANPGNLIPKKIDPKPFDPIEGERETIAHEVGHCLDGVHTDGGLMGTGEWGSGVPLPPIVGQTGQQPIFSGKLLYKIYRIRKDGP
ncbi:MAG: tetratricopeptide repeat protein, partial [Planctomycetota bacterium]